ncbi:MAG: putative peptidoglycan lipid flippase, partial [Blastocatellia bacterium]|nr:putative peptidoglycan lipid flippase [Blastocatellia bacterium]
MSDWDTSRVTDQKPNSKLALSSVTSIRKWIIAGFGLARISSWRERSTNHRIFATMVSVAALTCGVKIIATMKESVVAQQFGVSDYLDAFLIAYILPSFAINVISGSFNSALIPTYIQVREGDGLKPAQRLISSTTLWSLGLLATVTLILGLGSSPLLRLLGANFAPAKLELTHSLFLLLLPVLPLAGISTVCAAILNANQRFAVVSTVPAVTPVCVIIGACVFGKDWGTYAIAGGILFASCLESLLLIFSLKRLGISITPRWYGMNPAIKGVLKQYAPMIAAGFIVNGAVLVDQSMAARLGPGSVSVLNYGNRIVTVALGIGTMALSTAVLPQFSRMVVQKDWSGVNHTLRTYTRLILIVTIPVATVFILLSKPLVRLLFEH